MISIVSGVDEKSPYIPCMRFANGIYIEGDDATSVEVSIWPEIHVCTRGHKKVFEFLWGMSFVSQGESLKDHFLNGMQGIEMRGNAYCSCSKSVTLNPTSHLAVRIGHDTLTINQNLFEKMSRLVSDPSDVLSMTFPWPPETTLTFREFSRSHAGKIIAQQPFIDSIPENVRHALASIEYSRLELLILFAKFPATVKLFDLNPVLTISSAFYYGEGKTLEWYFDMDQIDLVPQSRIAEILEFGSGNRGATILAKMSPKWIDAEALEMLRKVIQDEVTCELLNQLSAIDNLILVMVSEPIVGYRLSVQLLNEALQTKLPSWLFDFREFSKGVLASGCDELTEAFCRQLDDAPLDSSELDEERFMASENLKALISEISSLERKLISSDIGFEPRARFENLKSLHIYHKCLVDLKIIE